MGSIRWGWDGTASDLYSCIGRQPPRLEANGPRHPAFAIGSCETSRKALGCWRPGRVRGQNRESLIASSNLAVLIDFENLALGFPPGRQSKFDIHRVLDRLLDKGKVVAKIAYADWSRFEKHKAALHEAGIELIEIPKRKTTGKNSADIRLVVDAMDLSYSKEHIDTFVVVSGDSDFSPLVLKLKENGKSVIGLGMRESTSKLLADNCDEFIYYEDLGGESPPLGGTAGSRKIPSGKQEAFSLLFDAIRALQREGHDLLLASRIKETIKRKHPSFSETAYGYRSFSELLEDVEEGGFAELRVDEPSGTYVVARLKTGRRRRRSKS